VSIIATDVSVHYPRAAAPALDRVSMRLDPGEVLLVAGPNGSGKSTLLRALLGLQPTTTGAVIIDELAVMRWRRRQLAQRVGALAQHEETAFPLRVADAVLLGRWARLGPLAPVSAADREAVTAAMVRTNVADLADRTTDTLSGGERQRVRLARALAGTPRFLLLDEPGTALDLAHEMAMLELLRGLADDGIGILAITHHLNASVQYADRVLLLDKGRLAAAGPPAEVLTAARVSEVFGWPVHVQHLTSGAPNLVPHRRHAPRPEPDQ
jgi:iron complex transport system ATP-binding protein